MPRPNIAHQNPNNSYRKFLQWTDEKEILVEAIANYIKPSHTSLLDIGVGDGDLSAKLAPYFRTVTIIEPSIALVNSAQEKLPDAEVHHSKIETFRTNQTFDFILASHVFIYIESPENIIDQLLSMLKPGGRLLIIMIDEAGDYLRFTNHFGQIVKGFSQKLNEHGAQNLLNILIDNKISFKQGCRSVSY